MKLTPVLSAWLMTGAAVVAFVPVVTAAQPAATAQRVDLMPRPVVKAGYSVPRLSNGRPDLQGTWSNATATPLSRPTRYGDRLALTEEEAREAEQSTAERNARQNARTDETVIENWEELGLEPDTSDECRSGSRGAACGYNAGWTDPGDLVMRVNGQPRTSMITFPANGRVPEAIGGRGGRRGAPDPTQLSRARGGDVDTGGEEGPAQTRQGQNDNPEGRSLGERCIMSFGVSSGPVMTPQLYNNTYRFVQTDDHVAIWVEMIHDVRIVRLNSEHRNDGVTPWMGDSIGWWDGDTLVVETTDYNPKQNLRRGGPNMKVTERFTRVAPDRLHYAFQVEDPEVWAEPWGGEYEFAAAPGIYEYACHEGNYGLENILAGARFEEQEAAAAR